MKYYKFKIRPQFLDPIEKGVKKHEYRLNSLERSEIQNGDRIILVSNQNDNDFVVVSVKGTIKYPSWEEALKDNWEEDFKGTYETFDDVLNICSKFYSRDDVKKYGIIKLDIVPIPLKLRNNKVLLDTNIIIQREGYNNVSYEVTSLYKWLDKLKSVKYIHEDTKKELQNHKNIKIKEAFDVKANAYEVLASHEINNNQFAQGVNRFSSDSNSQIDNKILYQCYEGLVDILLTNDRAILKKAELLGIRKFVLSVDEYLKIVEENFPDKVDYEMLSIRKEKFANINLDNKFFDTLKEDYPEFVDWFNNKSQEEAYVFRKENEVHGFLYVKVEYENEEGYSLINPPLSKMKRLKVGTFKIDTTLQGFRLGERFIKIIFDNAMTNKVDEVYVTLYENHREEIDVLKKLLCKWGFYYYGYKPDSRGGKESVLVKKMNCYDPSKDIKYNFPNLPKDNKMFFLPINPEYHTDLFPDAILKTEDSNLYSDNKGHLYALEKVYVSNSRNHNVKPGDLIVIYRIGDRTPKRYSSVCTSLAVLEEISYPNNIEKYLDMCSNKSVFSEEELNDFYTNKNYQTVIKLILYKTYLNKISLDKLIQAGLFSFDEGPRPFTEIDDKYRAIFLKEPKTK